MRQELMDRIQNIMNKACEYRNSFDNYAYLWVDDRNEFMRQFLLYNHVLTTEEIEAHADEGVPESPPTLAQFKDQVSLRLHKMQSRLGRDTNFFQNGGERDGERPFSLSFLLFHFIIIFYMFISLSKNHP